MASLSANDRLVLRLANMVMVEVLGIDHYMSLLVRRSLTLYTKWGQAIRCVHVHATGCVYTMVSVCV